MPILTLTSDIGQQDYLVGAVKGQILKTIPDASLIDISHSLPPFNYPVASYICRNAIRNFPAYTFHLLLINLFSRKPKRLVLAFHEEQYILCADNGLLGMLLDAKPELVIGIPLSDTEVKNTIYLARVMAETIQRIQAGTSILEIGEPDITIEEKHPLRPTLGESWMEGQILLIDHFENIVVNITREQFEQQRKGRRFTIQFRHNEKISSISETYADVQEGEKLALFNAAGYLEISINKGNAAGLLGLQGFSEQSQNRLLYQTVQIEFY